MAASSKQPLSMITAIRDYVTKMVTDVAGMKVLVMDAGRVAEFDSPEALKATPGSIFGGLCAAAEH